MTVALPLTGHRARIEDAGDGTLRIVRLADGTPAGRIRLETHGRDLYIAALCIDVPARGYGLGSEAAASSAKPPRPGPGMH